MWGVAIEGMDIWYFRTITVSELHRSKMNSGPGLDSNFEIYYSFIVKIFVFKMEKSII